jgi:anti-sigma B factor antagonist
VATSQVRVAQDESGVWLIELIGEHDLSTVPDLAGALDEVFSHGTRILIDLSETTFIDSTIISTLVAAQRRSDEQPNETLIIAAPPGGGQPAALFDLVQLRQIVSIAESRGTALRELTNDTGVPLDSP